MMYTKFPIIFSVITLLSSTHAIFGMTESSCSTNIEPLGIQTNTEILSAMAASSQLTGRQCVAFESQFREQIKKEIEGSIAQYSFLESCFNETLRDENHPCNSSRENEVNSLIDNVTSYRRINEKFHQNLAVKWINEQRDYPVQILESYFVSSDVVQFGDHLNTLKPSDNIPFVAPGFSMAWSSYATGLGRVEAMDNPESVGLDQNEVDELKMFDNSFAKNLFSSQTTHNPHLNPQELKESVHFDLQRMMSALNEFYKKINQFDDAELYKLYDFGNQHERFVESLATENQQEVARACKARGFISDCNVVGTLTYGVVGTLTYGVLGESQESLVDGRCGSRSWGIAVEFMPVLGMIDAMNGYQDVIVAETSGVMTIEEADQRNSELSMQFLFGIPLPPLAGLGARAGVQSVARIAASREASDVILNPRFVTTAIDRAVISSADVFKRLSRIEQKALKSYKEGGYRGMNRAYRAHPLIRPFSLATCINCNSLVSALKKLPNYKGVVYRGVKTRKINKYRKYLVEGDVVTEKGFLSASRHLDVADLFSSRRGRTSQYSLNFVINSKTGKSIENSADGYLYTEREVLFLPGKQFKVDVVSKVNETEYVIYLTEL